MILAAGAAMAQKTFTFGPKIGVDYTHFWGKDSKTGKGLFNYQAGVFMEYRFNDKFSIAPEVVFAAQGDKMDIFYTEYDENANPIGEAKCHETDHMNYINVPIMLKYYVIPSLSIDFGPQLGINVYSKYNYDGSPYAGDYDNKEYTKTIDFGLGLGLTYNITNDVFVQGRYTLGITKVFKNLAYDDYKNGNAQIAIGYRF
jgi:hypothetical protein